MKIASRIVDRNTAASQRDAWRSSGGKVVFTNGCFDILHKGHIDYLEKAAALGQYLVVGINSDASTARLKGPSRPINHQDSRAYLMASLTFVDLVVIFEEDTPKELIDRIRPDVLVKGGDYTAEDVVGRERVIADGGEVVILPFLEGFSTSAIEAKILALQHTSSFHEEE